jgi:peptide-methionine (S)-S-oxide reductase
MRAVLRKIRRTRRFARAGPGTPRSSSWFSIQRFCATRRWKTFWEAHDPTQGFRQGNDIGTQYRSAIYTTTPEQLAAAEASQAAYAKAIAGKGFGAITTEVKPAGQVYLAEDYHQQYLAKVPHGYCGLAGTGVTCPMPSGAEAKV